MTALATPQRRRLPNRRMASTHDIDVGNTRVTATVGFDEAGRPAERGITPGMLGKSCGRAPAPDGSRLVAASAAAAALDLLAELVDRRPV